MESHHDSMRLIFQAPPGEEPFAVNVPLSKSVAARALLIAAAAGDDPADVWPAGREMSEDVNIIYLAACKIWRALRGPRDPKRYRESYSAPWGAIDIHDSGTAKRLLTAWFACMPGARITLRQSERLAVRPLGQLPELLRKIGAGTVREGRDSAGRYIAIEGRAARGISIYMPVEAGISSQIITALLLPAFSMPLGLKLRLMPPVVSASYIEMTARLLTECRAPVEFDRETGRISASPSRPVLPGRSLMEADWSSASYFYEYVALARRSLRIPSLTLDSVQGDSRCARLFARLGVATEERDGGITLTPVPVEARELTADMSSIPDLVPALAVTCAMLGIPFRFSGVAHLRVKECDRVEALIANLRLFGLEAESGADSLALQAPVCPVFPTAPIAVYGDHRMAMSFAPAAVRFPGIVISNPAVVGKSFPEYWACMCQAGIMSSGSCPPSHNK